MKYVSENRLHDFVFHDCEMKLLSYEDGNLAVKAGFMNLSKNSPLNEEGLDMQMGEAEIVFTLFGANSLDPVSYSQGLFGEDDTEDFFVKPDFTVSDEATRSFVEELKTGITVQETGIDSFGYHYLSACGQNGWFDVKFIYYNVTVSWDEFAGPAWYEKKK